MDCFRQVFRDENHKNWLKCLVALKLLQTPLKLFVDDELELFHKQLLNICGATRCEEGCSFQGWKPNHDPGLCVWCSDWRCEILKNHTTPRGKVMWKNSKPNLWVSNKWEVAKVYMTDGHKNHESVDDFDIAALLSVISKCKHFQNLNIGRFCQQVACVRNNIMHSPNFQLKLKDMRDYLKQIKELGMLLAQHDPQFKSLSEDIDEIQKLDFQLILPDNVAPDEIEAYDEKEHENILFDSIKVKDLEQCLQEREREMVRVRRSYQTLLSLQHERLVQRDQVIEDMNSAIEQETAQHQHTKRELRWLKRENTLLRQENRRLQETAQHQHTKRENTQQQQYVPSAPGVGGPRCSPNPSSVDLAKIPIIIGTVAMAIMCLLAIL